MSIHDGACCVDADAEIASLREQLAKAQADTRQAIADATYTETVRAEAAEAKVAERDKRIEALCSSLDELFPRIQYRPALWRAIDAARAEEKGE